MKKVVSVLLIIVLSISSIALLCGCGGKNENNNTEPTSQKEEKKKFKLPELPNPLEKKRQITAINNTGEAIKIVILYTDNGREVGSKTNPGKDYTFKISKDYKDYDTFVVEMIDRYDSKYEVSKKINDSGNTDFEVSSSDQTENNKGFFDDILD